MLFQLVVSFFDTRYPDHLLFLDELEAYQAAAEWIKLGMEGEATMYVSLTDISSIGTAGLKLFSINLYEGEIDMIDTRKWAMYFDDSSFISHPLEEHSAPLPGADPDYQPF